MTTATAQQPRNLTSGRLLARNTVWNLFGQLLPMAVGVVAVPPLVRGLGVDRFGLLSLAWIIIGYFSLFDLGLGRALTKLVADKLGANQEHDIPPLAWTSLLLMLLLGIAGSVVALAISPWLVHHALKLPAALQPEALSSFVLMGISIPIVTVTSGLRGILEAQQRFQLLNLIRIPMSIFSFVGPVLVLPFSQSLIHVVAALIAGRLLGCAAHLAACLHSFPTLRHNFGLDRAIVMPALKFGGWMTVSNVVGPLLVYLDRFLIGSLLSVGAVAYYTAPFDMVNRLWVVAGALAGVLFPAFAVSLMQDPNRAEMLLVKGEKYIFLSVFPIILAIVTFAPEGLQLWLGPDFAHHGSAVLRWLAAGVLINSLAHVPLALIHSAGRPDITAKLHALELPPYIVALWLLTTHFGIEGTAIAWVCRIVVDAFLICVYAQMLLPRKSTFLTRTGIAMAGGLLALYLATLPQIMPVKIIFFCGAELLFVLGVLSTSISMKRLLYARQ